MRATTHDELAGRFGRARFMLLTTYRGDGRSVATPVWFAGIGDGIAIVTHATSGKVKRLRADPRAVASACTSRGKPTGPEVPLMASFLDGEAASRAARALSRRYFGLPAWLIESVMRRRGDGAPPTYIQLDSPRAGP